jgi:hypothetical protein
VKWLLKEGGSNIDEENRFGMTALYVAACTGKLETAGWLVEHGGADIVDMAIGGSTVWDERHFIDDKHDAAVVTALLRVMVLQDAPPTALTARLSPEHKRVVWDGARLRVQLPAYLA